MSFEKHTSCMKQHEQSKQTFQNENCLYKSKSHSFDGKIDKNGLLLSFDKQMRWTKREKTKVHRLE